MELLDGAEPGCPRGRPDLLVTHAVLEVGAIGEQVVLDRGEDVSVPLVRTVVPTHRSEVADPGGKVLGVLLHRRGSSGLLAVSCGGRFRL